MTTVHGFVPQEARQGVLGELAALADARPRNLFLVGLFVADHQLPECGAQPAAPEPVVAPQPLEAPAPTAVPVPAHLPAPSSYIGALLPYFPSGTSMAAAVVTQPTSAAAAQPIGGIAEGGAAQSGPGRRPSPPAVPNARPQPAESVPNVPDIAAPVPTAEQNAEPAAAAHPAQDAAPACRPDHSTPKGGAAPAPLEQMQDDANDRPMTRWGAEVPSPLPPRHSWTGRLVNNAATEAAVSNVRPAQHGALSGLEAALEPAPPARQTGAVPAAGKPAQPPGGNSATAAPSDDAVPPVGTVQAPGPATTADDTQQAATGTAPKAPELNSGSEAALAHEKASVCSDGDAAAAKVGTLRRPTAATASEEQTDTILEKPRRRSELASAHRNSSSRDRSRTQRPSDGRTDELGQQASEHREDASRSRRSSGRRRDRSRTRRRSTDERPGSRKRPHSGSRSSDRQKRRRSRDSCGDRRDRRRRRDDSRDRQVRSCSRPDPSDLHHGSDPWGPSAAPAASMANVLMMTTEPEERAELLASALGQVQQSDKQTPAPHAAAVSEEGDDGDLPPLPDSPLLSQGLPGQADGDQEVAAAPESVEIPAAEAAPRVQDMVGKGEADGSRMPAAEDAEAQPPLSAGANAAAGMNEAAVPAAEAAAFLESLGGLRAHALHCSPAESGEAGTFGQPVGAEESPVPAELNGLKRKCRWHVVEPASRQDEGGQAKRQRVGLDSNATDGTPAAKEPSRGQPQPSYDMFSGLSQPPPRRPPPRGQPWPPAQSPPPLPVESASGGMPSLDVRSAPQRGDHTAWCAVKDGPPLPRHRPSGSAPPRSSAVGDEPRISSGDLLPAQSVPPPPPHGGQRRVGLRPALQDDGPEGPGSPQHGSYASSQSAPRSPSPAWWTRPARPAARPDSPSCTPRLRASTPPPARPYPATEWARALLATGINPLKWHLRTNMDFVRSIRTKLCAAGHGCETWLTTCAYAHTPRQLLTPDDNMLLVEVAREWESRGIPAEWKHVVKRPAVLHESLPAARTPEVAQQRGKDVNPMAPPPPRSKDVNPMAPRATELQPDGDPSLAEVQAQQLPLSMINEDLEIEESLMHLITVRLCHRFVHLLYKMTLCSNA